MNKEQEEAIEYFEKRKQGRNYFVDYEEVMLHEQTLLKLIRENETEKKTMQAELEKKDKIIDLMAETKMLDTAKMETFWCNGCMEIARCKYNNNIMTCIKQYFERKVGAEEKTQENIEKNFWTLVKNQINNKIAEAIKNGKFNIQLDEEYIKYFYLIRLYYKKDKKYKVSKIFYGPFCEFWSGIEISWEG